MRMGHHTSWMVTQCGVLGIWAAAGLSGPCRGAERPVEVEQSDGTILFEKHL